jgi:hypothetical protein
MCRTKTTVWTVCAHTNSATTECTPAISLGPFKFRLSACNPANSLELILGWCPTCIDFYNPADLRNIFVVKNYWDYKAMKGWDMSVEPRLIPGYVLFKTYVRPLAQRGLSCEEKALQKALGAFHSDATPANDDASRDGYGFAHGMPRPRNIEAYLGQLRVATLEWADAWDVPIFTSKVRDVLIDNTKPFRPSIPPLLQLTDRRVESFSLPPTTVIKTPSPEEMWLPRGLLHDDEDSGSVYMEVGISSADLNAAIPASYLGSPSSDSAFENFFDFGNYRRFSSGCYRPDRVLAHPARSGSPCYAHGMARVDGCGYCQHGLLMEKAMAPWRPSQSAPPFAGQESILEYVVGTDAKCFCELPGMVTCNPCLARQESEEKFGMTWI